MFWNLRFGKKVHYWTNPKMCPIMPLKPNLYFHIKKMALLQRSIALMIHIWPMNGRRGLGGREEEIERAVQKN